MASQEYSSHRLLHSVVPLSLASQHYFTALPSPKLYKGHYEERLRKHILPVPATMTEVVRKRRPAGVTVEEGMATSYDRSHIGSEKASCTIQA